MKAWKPGPIGRRLPTAPATRKRISPSQVNGIEDLLGYGTRGGTDSAVFHGSDAGDKLKSYDDSLRLRAKDASYIQRAKRFTTIVGDGGTGGNDLAVFNGTDGDETFTYLGADGSATVEGRRRDHTARGIWVGRCPGPERTVAMWRTSPTFRGPRTTSTM